MHDGPLRHNRPDHTLQVLPPLLAALARDGPIARAAARRRYNGGMNDQSAGWSPDSGDDDYDGEGHRLRSALERTLMDRARRAAERTGRKARDARCSTRSRSPRPLVLMLVIGLGFDAFLTSVQKVMRMLDEEEARQKQQQQQEQVAARSVGADAGLRRARRRRVTGPPAAPGIQR